MIFLFLNRVCVCVLSFSFATTGKLFFKRIIFIYVFRYKQGYKHTKKRTKYRTLLAQNDSKKLIKIQNKQK